jgi:flagellin
MSLRISSYLPSLAAQRYLSKTQREIERSQVALASGKRIVSSADDAAGFAISESLRGQITGTRQGKENAENAVSLIQTAEGGLAEQNNILVRLRELAVYAASDTIGDTEREFLDNGISFAACARQGAFTWR